MTIKMLTPPGMCLNVFIYTCTMMDLRPQYYTKFQSHRIFGTKEVDR